MKKRRIRYFFLSAICLILSAACFLTGKYLHNRGNDFFKNLTIEAEGEGFEGKWLISYLSEELDGSNTEESAEEKTSFAAWAEFKNEMVFEASSRRAGSTDIIAVCGSSFCLLPFGKNLTEKDSIGCVIGKEMAEKLFGDSKAEGQEILWREQKWVVRSVVSEPADFVMVEAFSLADEILFDRINIVLEKNEDRQMKGESFISQNGLSAHALRFDCLGNLSWLKEMVPGKWSDFDGWKQNFKEYKQAKELVKNAKKSALESTGMEDWKKGNRLLFLGLIFLVAAGVFVFYSHYDTIV